MPEYDLTSQLPAGLTAALSEDAVASDWFGALSVNAQQALIERTRALRSKEEVRAFVNRMGRGDPML